MMSHRFQINNNGDTAETLRDEFKAVMVAAEALSSALKNCTLNGRNYQTLSWPDGALSLDREDKEEMMRRTLSVKDWAFEGALRAMKQGEK